MGARQPHARQNVLDDALDARSGDVGPGEEFIPDFAVDDGTVDYVGEMGLDGRIESWLGARRIRGVMDVTGAPDAPPAPILEPVLARCQDRLEQQMDDIEKRNRETIACGERRLAALRWIYATGNSRGVGKSVGVALLLLRLIAEGVIKRATILVPEREMGRNLRDEILEQIAKQVADDPLCGQDRLAVETWDGMAHLCKNPAAGAVRTAEAPMSRLCESPRDRMLDAIEARAAAPKGRSGKPRSPRKGARRAPPADSRVRHAVGDVAGDSAICGPRAPS